METRTRGEFKGYRLRLSTSGRWTYEIRIKGKPTKSGTFPPGVSKAEASRLAFAEYESIAKKNLPSYKETILNKLTLKELIETYLTECKQSNSGSIGPYKIKQGFDLEEGMLNRFIRKNPDLVGKKLGQLESDDFQDYIDRRLNKDCKTAATVIRELNPVWFILGRYARKVKKIPVPELRKDVVFPQEINEPGKCLTREAVEFIYRVLLPLPYYDTKTRKVVSVRYDIQIQQKLLIEMALETGVRLGGLLKIRLGDLDLDHYCYTQLPDKKSPTRVLPLSYHMVREIRAWVNRIPKQLQTPEQTLFHIVRGPTKFKPIPSATAGAFFSTQTILRVIREARDKGKIDIAYCLKDVTFHDLRHTSRTWMVELGLHPHEWQYMHGVLKDRYLHEYIPTIRDKIDPDWRRLTNLEQHKPKARTDTFGDNLRKLAQKAKV